jgi:hypothetical protein
MGFERDRTDSWRFGKACSSRSEDSLGGSELPVLPHAAKLFLDYVYKPSASAATRIHGTMCHTPQRPKQINIMTYYRQRTHLKGYFFGWRVREGSIL